MESVKQRAHISLPDARAVLWGALDQRWRNYRKALKGCQSKFTAKRVHQLRIALRRCMALLDTLRVAVSEKDTASICRSLSQQLKQLAPLRDAQNQLHFIAQLSGPSQPVPKALVSKLSRRETKLIKQISRKICRMDVGKLKRRMMMLAEKLCQACETSSAPYLRLRAHAALTERFAVVMWRLSDVRPDHLDSIHQLRVAFKKYRYMAEIWQPLFPQFTDEQLGNMQALQNRLGEIQDMHVLRQILRDFKDPKEKKIAAWCERVESGLEARLKDLPNHLVQLIDFQPGVFEFKAA